MSRAAFLLLLGAGLAAAAVDVRWSGGLYPRFQLDPMGSTFELMGAEVVAQAQVSSATRDIMTAFVQVYASGAMTQMGDWLRGFHFGQAYALLPLGLGWPSVKVGQAVVPFGLLAAYDVHTQIVQTPYARTLGLRLDPGIGLEGAAGSLDYSLWVSNGSGPDRMDSDRDKVISARLAPKFLWGDAEIMPGLSGLAGSLPYWPIESLGTMGWGPRSLARKYRLGLDNTADWGPLTIRLEAVAGYDSSFSSRPVFGYYAEARYAFTRWFEPLLAYDGWYAAGSARTLSAGLSLKHPDFSLVELQTVYERRFTRTESINESDWRFITQLAARF